MFVENVIDDIWYYLSIMEKIDICFLLTTIIKTSCIISSSFIIVFSQWLYSTIPPQPTNTTTIIPQSRPPQQMEPLSETSSAATSPVYVPTGMEKR